jgi:flagellar hook-length control protein FliK
MNSPPAPTCAARPTPEETVMLGSAQFVSPKPASLPPAAPPATPGTAPHGGPSFMQFMNEQPAMATPPQAGPAPGSPGSPDDAPPASAAPAPASAQNAATRRKETPPAPSKAPAPASATTEATAKNAEASTTTEDATAASDAADEDADEPARTSSLTEFTQLIGLAVPTATSTADAALATTRALDVDGTTAATDGATGSAAAGSRLGAGARAVRGVPGADDTAAATGGRPTDLPDEKSATIDRRLTDTAVRGAEASRARVVDAAADKAALIAPRNAGNDTATAVTARTPDASGPRPLGAVDGAAPNFAAVLAQSMPNGISAPDATPAPVSGQVHAAVHSPGFAPELAANVSLLAADGVHQAELQLNPADMGPVAVQIIVDGAQAQVSFHAAQADTRQALEQSLPDLAAALQGQGLTLSGGGVFQQARRDAQAGDAEGGGSNDRSGRAAAAGGRISGSGSTAAVSVRRAAGLLDAFA